MCPGTVASKASACMKLTCTILVLPPGIQARREDAESGWVHTREASVAESCYLFCHSAWPYFPALVSCEHLLLVPICLLKGQAQGELIRKTFFFSGLGRIPRQLLLPSSFLPFQLHNGVQYGPQGKLVILQSLLLHCTQPSHQPSGALPESMTVAWHMTTPSHPTPAGSSNQPGHTSLELPDVLFSKDSHDPCLSLQCQPGQDTKDP